MTVLCVSHCPVPPGRVSDCPMCLPFSCVPREELVTEEDLCYTDYESGQYSPVLLQPGDLEPDAIVYDPQEDLGRLDFARTQVKRTGQAKVRGHSTHSQGETNSVTGKETIDNLSRVIRGFLDQWSVFHVLSPDKGIQ